MLMIMQCEAESLSVNYCKNTDVDLVLKDTNH